MQKKEIQLMILVKFLDNEFIGLIYVEDDEGEVSYQFHMTILSEDLLNS